MAKIRTLTENFNTKDTVKWSWSTAASVSGGQAVLPVNSSYTGEIASVSSYDLASSSLSVQLVQAPNAGSGSTELFVKVMLDQNNQVYFYLNGGLLDAGYKVAGTETVVGSIAYNAATMKYLRIRHTGSQVIWEYSATGATWTQIGAGWTPTFSITAVKADIYAGYYGTEASPGTVIIDNVNLATGSSVDPSTIPSLAARWVASDLALADGASVASWTARTGSGTLTGTGTAQPVYKTASLVGSRPAVRFDGVDDFLSANAGVTNLGTAETIVVIMYPSSLTTLQEIIQWGSVELLVNSAGTVQLWSGAALNSPSALSAAPHVLGFLADATTSDQIYVDGTLAVTGTAGNPTGDVGLRMGNYGTGGRFLKGDIAEVLAFNTKLTAAQMAVVDTYAQDTYGIVVSDYSATPTTLDKLKLGDGVVGLRVGALAASKAYIGATQVWP